MWQVAVVSDRLSPDAGGLGDDIRVLSVLQTFAVAPRAKRFRPRNDKSVARGPFGHQFDALMALQAILHWLLKHSTGPIPIVQVSQHSRRETAGSACTLGRLTRRSA